MRLRARKRRRQRPCAEFAQVAFSCVGLEADTYLRVDQTLVRAPEVTLNIGDPTRARERLGWRPELSFEGLVERMVEADLHALQAEPAADRAQLAGRRRPVAAAGRAGAAASSGAPERSRAASGARAGRCKPAVVTDAAR